MKYEKLAEKINNGRFAGHVQQSQHKVEVFDEKNILREVSSGAKVDGYDPDYPTYAHKHYNSYFGADPKEVAGIIEELEKRKPELVYRDVWDIASTKSNCIEVDEFYKDKDRIVEIKKGYVIDKGEVLAGSHEVDTGARYEGYGHPKEYSLEDGTELVQYMKEMNSNKNWAKGMFAACVTVISTLAIAVYPAAIVPAVAGWGYFLHELKTGEAKEKRMDAIKKRAKVIHSPI